MAYQYFRTITLDHTKVPNTDQNNFPALVSITDATLGTSANGGHVQNANGYDLVFASDAAGQNLLAWEVESYNPATGALLAWVKIPTLSHTVDTTIYLCYGNAAISTDQSNSTDAWDSNYAGVWHLSDVTAAGLADSTNNSNNGVAIGSPVTATGPINGAISIAGGGIDVGHGSSLNVGNVLTVSAWVYHAATLARSGIFTTRANNAPNSWQLEAGPADGSVANALGITAPNTYDATSSSNAVPAGAWTYVVFTRNGNDASNALYANGAALTVTPAFAVGGAPAFVTFADNIADRQIGLGTSGGQSWPGSIAEVRISKIARSADWIAAEYANQYSPGAFCTVGAEQSTQSKPVITWTNPAEIPYGTVLSNTQLNATANTPGTFDYTPAAGTVLSAGTQTLSVTFTPADTAGYTTASASVAIAVVKATPVITWPTPAAITEGTALSSAQLNAMASVPGTFVYNPAAGAVLASGNQTLSATFTPGDAASYTTATDSVILQVNPPAPPPPSGTYYPQFINAMIAQAGYLPQVSFQTTGQDVDCGFWRTFAWFAEGLQGFPPAPLYSWTLFHNGLKDDESAALENFFEQMKGRSGTFAYLDPGGNLCQYSEDFTQAAWTNSNLTVSANGGVGDPFGGMAASTITASAADASLSTMVLPSGGASTFTLCGSVWVKAETAQAFQIGFTDGSGTLLESQTWELPAGTWVRIYAQILLTVNSNIMLQIGGGNTWANGVALSLYGAHCGPCIAPGVYAKTPGDYGLHPNVRFDQDTLVITKIACDNNSTTVKLREFDPVS